MNWFLNPGISYKALITLFSLIPFVLFAQSYTSIANANPQLIKNYDGAKELNKTKEYDKALQRLDKALKIEPRFIDALILKSEILYAKGGTAEAIRSLEESIALDSLYEPRSLYSLARLYELMEEYGVAESNMKAYVAHGNLTPKRNEEILLRIAALEFKDSLVSSPVRFDPEPLPGLVNTDHDEALPAVTIDGNRMVFTRREDGVEDLYYSLWDQENHQWGQGLPISSINSVLNEGSHAISANGSVIAFTSCHRRQSLGGCDIYVARQLSDGLWTAAVNPEELNSAAWDGQPSLTPDGRGMFFSSSRDGGFGNRDLWYSELQTNGRWSLPVNCGAVINTSGNESSPFMHFDDRTLYFMSDGHPGMGDYDIFTSFRKMDSWSKPRNLGYPINTVKREGGLSVHPNGQTAYFTSESIKGGTMDIYQFDLPKELQPGMISYLTGLVYNVTTKLPVEAVISIYVLQDPDQEFIYQARSDGTFTAALGHGQRYGVHVTSPGFAFYSLQFEFDSIRPYGHEDLRIPLQPIGRNEGKSDEPIVLRNVEFESGSSTLLESSYSELDLLLQMLRENPDNRIQIHGHTDNVGDNESNLILSEQRARAVYEWLLENGIPGDQIAYMGFGETQPVDSNEIEKGRQRNRRTEFVFERK